MCVVVTSGVVLRLAEKTYDLVELILGNFVAIAVQALTHLAVEVHRIGNRILIPPIRDATIRLMKTDRIRGELATTMPAGGKRRVC